MMQPKRLPTAPLAALIRDKALRYGGLEPLLDHIGENHGHVCRMLKGTYVQERVADRICIKLGTHPALVWPDEWTTFTRYERPSRAKHSGPRPQKHGTRWGYDRGCRCGDCLEAGRSYYRARERRRAVA